MDESIKTPEETPGTGRQNLMNGNDRGQGFSATNQPPPDAKKKGWARRRAMRELLEMKTPVTIGDAKRDYRQLASDLFGIKEEDVTLEHTMHARQIEKAILQGDTAAYNAVMDRLKGKPKQPIELDTLKIHVKRK